MRDIHDFDRLRGATGSAETAPPWGGFSVVAALPNRPLMRSIRDFDIAATPD